MAAAGSILVVDWGIGGLATFAELAERLPEVPLAYLSDSGFTPWGKVEPDTLAERISALTAPLLDKGDLLVLACNAASTVIDRLRLPASVEVMGVIEPGVALLEREVRRGRRRLAVLGGARTIASGAHRLGLMASLGAARGTDADEYERDGVVVCELVAQPLSAHVEAGRLDGPELLTDLRPLMGSLEAAGCETALLACTHYPALLPVLVREAARSGGCDWLDPVTAPELGLVARVVRGRETDGRAATSGRPGPDLGMRRVATTGDPEAMREAALAAFGVHLLGAEARGGARSGDVEAHGGTIRVHRVL